jgi:dihydrofolate synthase/folylpolyglutamate synthase
VEPAITAITPVDYDHEAWLGNSIQAIASEKAGILKPGIPAVFATQRPEALAVLHDRAGTLKCPAYETSLWAVGNLQLHPSGCRFSLTRERPLSLECPLRGAWQVENARTAAAVLDLLKLPSHAIEHGIANVRWPGRLERLSTRPEVLVDGAHNPSGCAALAEYIRSTRGAHRTWLVFGAMRDKAISEMTSLLFPLADELILTALRQPRALRPEVLAEEAPQASSSPGSQGRAPFPRVRVAPAFADAMVLLKDAQPEDRVFIAGSLFLAGEAKAWFANSDSSSQSPLAS